MHTNEHRHVRLFRNGRNQAIRIPREFELEGSEAIIHRKGKYLIIEPITKQSLLEFLKTQPKRDEEFPKSIDRLPIDDLEF
ncbi:antitoxin [uncultured Thiothrix sp.]|uniref:antitoxin n=1 Tax=uncultured Thiothrix sp. TaxID=223185 RepID=UPI00261281E8|nr:AbrB/MazE/SpoVT family DNA-binding domain-containing protein [uncultured Thiothrix sp.]